MEEKQPSKFNNDIFRRLFIVVIVWLTSIAALLLGLIHLSVSQTVLIATTFGFAFGSGLLFRYIYKKMPPGYKLPFRYQMAIFVVIMVAWIVAKVADQAPLNFSWFVMPIILAVIMYESYVKEKNPAAKLVTKNAEYKIIIVLGLGTLGAAIYHLFNTGNPATSTMYGNLISGLLGALLMRSVMKLKSSEPIDTTPPKSDK